MVRRLAMGLAFLLVAAACSGSGGSSTSTTAPSTTAVTTTTGPTTTTTMPGFTVTSDDGDVTVEVPFEAMAEDPGIVIRLLAPEAYPPELTGAAERPGARIYQLEPDGLAFAAPVRVERRMDAAAFDLPDPTTIPIVSLLTQAADGSFELLDDIHVMRSGDDVFVSGETMHFSPLVAISEEQVARIDIDRAHTVFATEPGTPAYFGISFASADGTPLQRPEVRAWGRSRADFLAFGGDGELEVTCTGIGTATPRLGFHVDLRADAPADQPGLRNAPLLALGAETATFLLKIAGEFECLDEATSLIGLRVEYRYDIDHPGGEVKIPDEDFRGGLSAALQDFSGLPLSYVGLIGDANGNGILDLNDSIHQPELATGDRTMQMAVNPLFSYGGYFTYVVDAGSYGTLPDFGNGLSLEDGLLRLGGVFMGDGRFETSIGVVAVGGMPLLVEVGPAESAVEEPQAEIRILLDGIDLHF